MRTHSAAALAGLLALAAACGGGGGKELQYGAALAPSLEEQAAANDAQATLDAGRTFAPGSEPTYGAPGLADQLVAGLGGTPSVASLPRPAAARASRALGRAVSLPSPSVALDPACVTTTATSVTWRGCVASVSDVDPLTGDTTDMTIHVDGQLGWAPATGVTSWSIVETIGMVLTSDGQTMRMDATARLQGALTLTASTIKGQTSSSLDATVTFQGITAREAVTTTLVADLSYAADPFCLTGGTLTVAQVWTRRPAGATAADLPDQGWRFEWTGCGQFTVAHGS
jgi:hypothetical protein